MSLSVIFCDKRRKTNKTNNASKLSLIKRSSSNNSKRNNKNRNSIRHRHSIRKKINVKISTKMIDRISENKKGRNKDILLLKRRSKDKKLTRFQMMKFLTMLLWLFLKTISNVWRKRRREWNNKRNSNSLSKRHPHLLLPRLSTWHLRLPWNQRLLQRQPWLLLLYPRLLHHHLKLPWRQRLPRHNPCHRPRHLHPSLCLLLKLLQHPQLVVKVLLLRR